MGSDSGGKVTQVVTMVRCHMGSDSGGDVTRVMTLG